MSANILYRPVTPNDGKSLGVSAPSAFLETMGKCFGDPPFTLERKDIPILSGMAAAWTDEAGYPFQGIIELIEKYGTIQVWAEY